MALSESLENLANSLSRLQSVKNLGEEESWTLAHDFNDIEESCLLILNELFPKLLNESLTLEELEDVLLDIGEEFRHVAYHIGNSNFYRYLGVSSPERDEDD